MMASLKLILLFAIILGLTRLKLKIGLSIAVGSVVAGFMFRMEPELLLNSIWIGFKAPDTWQLLLILVSVSFIGSLLKNSGRAAGLTGAVESLLRSKRLSMATLPALIGLLPMPGGALLSAPLVDAAGKDTEIKPMKLAAINYWFRHILECVWPLYPGIILTASILELDASTIARAQWPMSAGMIIGGILFLLVPLGAQNSDKGNGRFGQSLRALSSGLWPIALAVVLSMVFNIALYLAVPVSLILFVLLSRFPGKMLLKAAKEASAFEYVSFVFAVMIFKQVLIDSQAASFVAAEITTAGIHPIWVVIFIPFIIGLISGATPAFVSLAYPALLPFIKPDDVDFLMMATAYGAGFLGVLVSPLHFCLVLTAEYFKVSLGRLYLYLLGPLALMIAGLLAKFAVA